MFQRKTRSSRDFTTELHFALAHSKPDEVNKLLVMATKEMTAQEKAKTAREERAAAKKRKAPAKKAPAKKAPAKRKPKRTKSAAKKATDSAASPTNDANDTNDAASPTNDANDTNDTNDAEDAEFASPTNDEDVDDESSSPVVAVGPTEWTSKKPPTVHQLAGIICSGHADPRYVESMARAVRKAYPPGTHIDDDDEAHIDEERYAEAYPPGRHIDEERYAEAFHKGDASLLPRQITSSDDERESARRALVYDKIYGSPVKPRYAKRGANGWEKKVGNWIDVTFVQETANNSMGLAFARTSGRIDVAVSRNSIASALGVVSGLVLTGLRSLSDGWEIITHRVPMLNDDQATYPRAMEMRFSTLELKAKNKDALRYILTDSIYDFYD